MTTTVSFILMVLISLGVTVTAGMTVSEALDAASGYDNPVVEFIDSSTPSSVLNTTITQDFIDEVTSRGTYMSVNGLEEFTNLYTYIFTDSGGTFNISCSDLDGNIVGTISPHMPFGTYESDVSPTGYIHLWYLESTISGSVVYYVDNGVLSPVGNASWYVPVSSDGNLLVGYVSSPTLVNNVTVGDQTLDSAYMIQARNLTSDSTGKWIYTGELTTYYVSIPSGVVGDVTDSTTYLNSDGTEIDSFVTDDGTTYIDVSDFSDSSLNQALSDALAKIHELEGEIDDLYDVINSQEAVAAASSYDGTLSEFMLDSSVTTVFPFCVPFDFVRGIKLFSVSPEAPVFSVPFAIPAFGLFSGYETEITIDFCDYDAYFVPVRWFNTVLFVIALLFVTFKIVKGV